MASIRIRDKGIVVELEGKTKQFVHTRLQVKERSIWSFTETWNPCFWKKNSKMYRERLPYFLDSCKVVVIVTVREEMQA